jgi:hypothetical protein
VITPDKRVVYGIAIRLADEHSLCDDPESISVRYLSTRLSFGNVDWVSRGGNDGGPWFGLLGSRYAYRFEGIAEFLLEGDGSAVTAYVNPSADPDNVRFVFDRGILPRLLHLRRVPCLHASSVLVQSGAVTFIGQSGSGKSTLAASLVVNGFPLVTDDVLPLRLIPGSHALLCGPGVAELRLHSLAAAIAGVHGLSSSSGGRKQIWRPRASLTVHQAIAMRRIYLLNLSTTDSLRHPAEVEGPLHRAEALLALMPHCFRLHSRERNALKAEFLCLGQALQCAEVWRLKYELTPAGLRAVQDIVRSA